MEYNKPMSSKPDDNIVPDVFKKFCDFLGKYSLFIIGSIYLLAILSVNAIAMETLVFLAPILYILSTIFIFVSHDKPRKKLLYCFSIIIGLGFIIELIALNSQTLFGDFSFGDALGLKILGTPFLIGIHWFLLGMGSNYLIRFVFDKRINQLFGASFLMIIGFIITDPVAQSLGIWSWDNYSFTLQNYSIRFLVSLLMQGVILYFLKDEKNQFAAYFYLLTTLFFMISNLVL